MALSVNNVVILGNLTRDPELRFTPNGTPVAGFGLAVTTGTVTITVDRLEKGGYARRVPQKGDRRTYIIELTPPGEQAFEEHHKHHRRLTEELIPLLSEEESSAFINILQKLNQHLF